MKCNSCHKSLELKPMKSSAGYYMGRSCDCGPYSRESKYFSSKAELEIQVKSG